MGHIFISYARADGSTNAARLEQALQAQGFATWRDTRGIDPAKDFTSTIEKAIEAASHVVVCITPDTKRDDSFVRREIQYALLAHKPVIVARLADILPPIHVVNHTWVELWEDWDTGFDRLTKMLDRPFENYRTPTLPSDTYDIFRPYVQKLYKRASDFLENAVIRLIDLDIEYTPDAVSQRTLDMLDILFADTDTNRSFKTFTEAFAYFNHRVLLLGKPGAGKTVSLMATVRDAAVARLADKNAPLPLFALIALWNASYQPSLEDWLGASDKDLSVEQIHPIVAAGEAMLFLDGLDELGAEQTEKLKNPKTGESIEHSYDPRKRFISMLKEQLGKNGTLITCRIADYASISNQISLDGAVTLQKLNDIQIQTYLNGLPNLLNAINNDNNLREIARTPLLLSYFAFAFRDRPLDLHAIEDLREGALRDAIFNAYFEKRYQREAQRLKKQGQVPRFTLERIREVLGRIAMNNIGGLSRRNSRDDKYSDNVLEIRDIRFALAEEPINPFIQFCLQMEYLQNKGDGTYSFIHLLLRDSLAYNFSLPRIREENLYTELFEPNPAVALGAIHDLRTVAPLIALLKDTSEQVLLRRCAAVGLGILGDNSNLEPLIKSFSDIGQYIRERARSFYRLETYWLQIQDQIEWIIKNEENDDVAAEICLLFPVVNWELLNTRTDPSTFIRWTEAALKVARRFMIEQLIHSYLIICSGSYVKLGNYHKALEYTEETIKLASKSDDLVDLAESYGMITNVYLAMGEVIKAQKYAIDAVERYRGLPDHQHHVAVMITTLGSISARLGQTQHANQYFREALAMFRTMNDQARAGQTLNNLAAVLMMEKRLDEAEPLLLEGMEIARRVGDQENESQILTNLGYIRQERKQYPQAKEFFQQSFDLSEKLNFQQKAGKTMSNIAGVIANTGDLDKAFSTFQGALSMLRESNDQYSVAVVLGNLSSIRAQQKQFNESEVYLKEARDILQSLNNVYEETQILVRVSNSYIKVGENLGARAMLEEALGLARQTNNTSHELQILESLGKIAIESQDYVQGLAYFERALARASETGDLRAKMIFLGRRGATLTYLQRYDKAVEDLQNAIALARKEANISEQYINLYNLGYALNSMNKQSEAAQYYAEAAALAHQARDEANEAVYTASQGMVEADIGQIVAALDHYHYALKLFQKLGDQNSIERINNMIAKLNR